MDFWKRSYREEGKGVRRNGPLKTVHHKKRHRKISPGARAYCELEDAISGMSIRDT